MDTYNIFSVWGDSKGVRLHTTDPTELEWIVSELKKIFPRLRIAGRQLPSVGETITSILKLPSGEGYYYFYFIDHLSDLDDNVLWWVIKQLCARGWEPLGAIGAACSSGPNIYSDIVYLFKRKG